MIHSHTRAAFDFDADTIHHVGHGFGEAVGLADGEGRGVERSYLGADEIVVQICELYGDPGGHELF